MSDSFYADAFLRFCVGFFQVFSCIYYPVWADAFANEKQKSTWLTILVLASPLGVVFGYIMSSLFVAAWRNDDLGDPN